MDIDVRAINEKIERESAFLEILTLEMNKVIVGQKQMIESLVNWTSRKWSHLIRGSSRTG
jgi:hypothetical protein